MGAGALQWLHKEKTLILLRLSPAEAPHPPHPAQILVPISQCCPPSCFQRSISFRPSVCSQRRKKSSSVRACRPDLWLLGRWMSRFWNVKASSPREHRCSLLQAHPALPKIPAHPCEPAALHPHGAQSVPEDSLSCIPLLHGKQQTLGGRRMRMKSESAPAAWTKPRGAVAASQRESPQLWNCSHTVKVGQGKRGRGRCSSSRYCQCSQLAGELPGPNSHSEEETEGKSKETFPPSLADRYG